MFKIGPCKTTPKVSLSYYFIAKNRGSEVEITYLWNNLQQNDTCPLKESHLENRHNKERMLRTCLFRSCNHKFASLRRANFGEDRAKTSFSKSIRNKLNIAKSLSICALVTYRGWIGKKSIFSHCKNTAFTIHTGLPMLFCSCYMGNAWIIMEPAVLFRKKTFAKTLSGVCNIFGKTLAKDYIQYKILRTWAAFVKI